MISLPAIRRTTGHGKQRPRCAHKVRMGPAWSRERARREHDAARTGRPAEECGRDAVYYVGGVPLCQNHAGQTVLNLLLKEGAVTAQ